MVGFFFFFFFVFFFLLGRCSAMSCRLILTLFGAKCLCYILVSRLNPCPTEPRYVLPLQTA